MRFPGRGFYGFSSANWKDLTQTGLGFKGLSGGNLEVVEDAGLVADQLGAAVAAGFEDEVVG
jgi:hypothetical protein